jgi:hypothetical protein|tara:strand:+ start:89 stop:286 length:198 start_codon:yes stop_codon:yes gene_type:complete
MGFKIMDIFETIERLKYISSKLDLDKLYSDSDQQLSYLKEIKRRVKTIDIERIDMSTMDKWEFND